MADDTRYSVVAFNVQGRIEIAMLVLSRKQTESIQISDNVVVTVLSIRGSRVRLGIVAPRNVSIHRKEMHTAIARLRIRHPACVPPSPVVTGPSVMAKPAANLLPETTQWPAKGIEPVGAVPAKS